MTKVLLIVMNPLRIVTQLCCSLTLYRAFSCLSALCFGFMTRNFIVLVHSHRSHQTQYFQPQQAAGFSSEALIYKQHSTQYQTADTLTHVR